MKNYLLAGALLASVAVSAAVVHVSQRGITRNLSQRSHVSKKMELGTRAVNSQQQKLNSRQRVQGIGMPWNIDFATSDLTGFTIIDANDDGSTWGYNVNTNEVEANYSPKDPMDDWLLTPALELVGGRAYTLKFKAACNSQTYPERLEIFYGEQPTVAAMVYPAMEATVVSDMDFREYSCVIVPRMSGPVYIGFHGISDANMYKLRIKSMGLTEGAAGETPSGVRDLSVSADDPYSLNATVSFYAPQTTMAGKQLDKIDKITLKRNGTLIKTFTNPQPGAELRHDDTVTEGGRYTYTVCASNAAGDGYVMTYTHAIGGVAPLAPDNVLLKEIQPAGTLHMTWDPVTKDVDGNTIPDGFVRYIVLDNSMEVVADNLTDTQVTFHLAQKEQIFVEMIVAAYTVGGLSQGTMSNIVAAGPAFTKWQESFGNGEIQTIMGYGYEYGYVDLVTWNLADDTTFTGSEFVQEGVKASDGDNGFAFMHCEYRDTGSSLFSGKVQLPAEGPAVSFNIFNQSLENIPDLNKLDIMVSEDGLNWETVESHTVYDLCGSAQGWHPVTIGLHEYAGKVVQIRWQVEVQSFADFLIDAISVGTLPDHDLKVETLGVPSKVAPGEDITLGLGVLNIGAKNADKYAVRLFVNDAVAKEMECTALQAGKRVNVEIPYTVSPVADDEINVRAEVVCDGDVDNANNMSKAYTLKVEQPRHPYVSDLDGSVDDKGVVSLSWSRPYVETYTPGKLEDFESGEDFAHSFGDWIFVDRDGLQVGNLTPSTIPGIEAGVSTASFFVVNGDQPHFTGTLKAHSGQKYIASMFSYYGEMTDDWAISPALNGAAQIISFHAKSLEEYYADTMEVYYSLGSTNPDDFIKVSTVEKVPGEWTEYNVPLPTGAKRFAIRSHSNNGMMLMLDDFIFADASAPIGLDLENYNIYCDDVKVGTVTGNVTEFSHPSTIGTHVYAVTASYKGMGESKSSNKKIIENTVDSGLDAVDADSSITVSASNGLMTIDGLTGEQYTVATIDGVVMATGRASGRVTLKVGAGVYVVKAGNHYVKIAI